MNNIETNILIELKMIRKLLGVMVTRDIKQDKAIQDLTKAGLQPAEIADLLGTTANTVRVQKSQAKKKRNR